MPKLKPTPETFSGSAPLHLDSVRSEGLAATSLSCTPDNIAFPQSGVPFTVTHPQAASQTSTTTQQRGVNTHA